MQRTTIMLPNDLRRKALEVARREEISLGELTRRALNVAVTQARKTGVAPDSLLDDHSLFRGRTPRNLAARHDFYLYGDQ